MTASPTSSAPPVVETGPTYWRIVWLRMLRDRVTIVSAVILLMIVALAIFANWISPWGPNEGSIAGRLKPVGSPGHWLGTDELGRDVLTRLIYGGRLSLLCGVLPVLAATIIGGFLGLVAGMSGSIVNSLIMRVTDVFFALPSVLLAVAISGAMGSGVVNLLISLTVVFIPPVLRISESLTRQICALDFIDAARASGAGLGTILWHEIVPNVIGPIMVYATSLVSMSVILAAGLSFLGLGVSPPASEWGLMLNSLRQAIYVNPLVAALPGVMIVICSMCFNLLSDGLRSAMDIRHTR